MTRRLLVLLALIFVPAAASAQNFQCSEQAFNLTDCPDLNDLSTCPMVCDDPDDDTTCSLPPLDPPVRADPAQPILRLVDVLSDSFSGAVLSMTALDAQADARFAAARDQLCVAPPPAPPSPPSPTPPPPTDDPDTPSPPAGGPVGGNPGLVGGNPGLVGGNPGIEIR